jgi:hypothetical protein
MVGFQSFLNPMCVCVCVVASGVTIEYTDDSFLVPKNTSVIIKRVPASGPKPILRVDEQ